MIESSEGHSKLKGIMDILASRELGGERGGTTQREENRNANSFADQLTTDLDKTDAHKVIEAYEKISKRTDPLLTHEEIQEIESEFEALNAKGSVTEIVGVAKDIKSVEYAHTQGQYEKKMSQVTTESAKKNVQNESGIKQSDVTELPVAVEGRNYVSAVEVVQDIAKVENAVYDDIMAQKLRRLKVQSIDELPPEKAQLLKQEVETAMDKKIRQIGLNYLRTINIGNNRIGKFLQRKVTEEASKYIHKDK